MEAASDSGASVGTASPYAGRADLAGSAGPGGPFVPWPGEDAGGPPGRPHHHALLIAAAAAAAVLAVTSVVALRAVHSAGVPPASQAPSAIVATVGPGLADVTATLGYRQAVSAGTGLVLTSSGLVVTNNHVIEGATSVKVTDVGNHQTYQAEVAGYDQGRDIALLKLTGASALKTVTLGNSLDVRVGEKVYALGNAGGLGGAPAVVSGTVTGLNQSITALDRAQGIAEKLTGLISASTPVEPGDSGGPLVTAAGQVIGMDTAGSAQFQIQSGAARAFAIPVSQVAAVAREIEAGQGSPGVHIGPTAFLGIAVVSVSLPRPGDTEAGVAGVIAGSPAARAGLAAGDVITSLGGHAVTSASAFRTVMAAYHPGDTITVCWVDLADRVHTAAVVLVTGPAG